MSASHVNGRIKKCTRCHARKDLDHFKRNGEAATCIACSETRRKKRDSGDKENPERDDDERLRKVLGNISFEDFLNTLDSDEVINSFLAFLDISTIPNTLSSRERADKITEHIWKDLGYRFNYNSFYVQKRDMGTRYVYSCAQNKIRQHRVKKTEGAKPRGKGQMDAFECDGWLHITIYPETNVALVKLKHMTDHTGYINIDVPDFVKEMIEKHPEMTPTQVWDNVLKKTGTDKIPRFSRKSVYWLCQEQASREWKRNQDEFKSARILIDEAARPAEGARTAEFIRLHSEDGFTALAFCLPQVLEKYGDNMRELQIDSAWNTNGSNYEVFALLGEIRGSNCPIGFLLLRTAPGSEKGGKQRFVEDLLRHVASDWNLHPIVTLTDKDMSEINALSSQFPQAKIQLCFWHCLRAVKTRLSIVRRQPKFYNVKQAMKDFDFIDETFVPIGQQKDPSKKNSYIAQSQIPKLNVLLEGVLQNQAPESETSSPSLPAPSQGRLAICLNGKVKAIIPLHPKDSADLTSTNNDDASDDDDDGPEGPSTSAENDGNASDEEDDSGELLRKVYQSYDLDANERDQEDGPDHMFDDDERPSKDPDYQFCKPPHRKQILHIFTKHFCQHQSLPDRYGTWDADKIYKNAVKEMYDFCRGRGLCEVWGYMWTCWYCPAMWKLWARSGSKYISRLRTTMGVENFWRQLKHDYLRHNARPRLDNLVFVLIYKVAPSFMARMGTLGDGHRLGRTKALTTYQKYFKTAWIKLETKTISANKEYKTDVKNWTCNCGRQKYDPHHLCKHLVQAVGHPEDTRFWSQIHRRRVVPLYRHPLLVEKGTEKGAYTEPNGNVTDGDDNLWSGDPSTLRSGKNGWRDIKGDGEGAAKNHPPRKRKQREVEASVSPETETPSQKRVREETNVIDLTMSSSPPSSPSPKSEFSEQFFEDLSSGFDYGSEDEQEMDDLVEKFSRQAKKLGEMKRILDDQIPHRNRIWLKRMAKAVGTQLDRMEEWVDDIHHHESTSRKRGTTWGEGKSKEEKRRALNTMGYVLT